MSNGYNLLEGISTLMVISDKLDRDPAPNRDDVVQYAARNKFCHPDNLLPIGRNNDQNQGISVV